MAKKLIKWATKNRCLHPCHPCQSGAMPPLLKVVCSGSILTRNIVISASHCFDQDSAGYFYNVSDLIVRAGATQIESDRHEEFDIDFHVRHPKHDPPKVSYDIALVKLVQKVTFNQRIQAICLPSSPQTIGGGVLVTVQGWGKSSDGYKGKLTEINVADFIGPERDFLR